jgi:hypothetical protein
MLFKSVFKPALRAAVSVSPVLAGGSAADAGDGDGDGDGVGASSSKWQEAAESIADTESILTLLMEALGTTAKDKQQPAAGSGGEGEGEEEGDKAASFRARVEGMLALKGSTWHAKQGPPQQGQEQGQEQPQREKLLTDLITVLVMSVTALDVYSEGDFSKTLMQTLLLNFLRQAQAQEEEEEEEEEEEGKEES